ncbi:diaminopimelate epimerase [Flavobacterium subsaxonicum]|uniref:Diaminopimelate epimerase n=1 Tax=Flavobacterium subsaxonicum WB 4.1-42 = DSM 21790 TaxID=1121898 RepID=A0A0A2MX90_9FLAO|nr:diaminopimelate epimerase [Flavobacterium subsaxonicum]KGO92840.1 diaminopimelate epimerase [Flavobacterium subsaxonicum WB 4.1-42 = DSM 21790]
MEYTFYKYQGTGNDFVMVDNRDDIFPKNDTKLVGHLCDRRFGIGADGLILLENAGSADFRMVYYNSDGNESTMCGNGGRCIVAFANALGIIDNETEFDAIDGRHHATIDENGIISLHMKDVNTVSMYEDYVFLDTGSPHHVEIVEDLPNLDVKGIGANIRYSGLYGDKGSNVNFVSQDGADRFSVRTYERGVEDETLSCGTGVTAVAIAMKVLGKTEANTVRLTTPGGELKVSFAQNGKQFTEVYLTGPARFVFKGEAEW